MSNRLHVVPALSNLYLAHDKVFFVQLEQVLRMCAFVHR